MCGIVGYAGENSAASVIIESLKKLEYRGYDSAGITVLGSGIDTYKSVGKIVNLEAVLPKGIRWKYRNRAYPLGNPRTTKHGKCPSA